MPYGALKRLVRRFARLRVGVAETPMPYGALKHKPTANNNAVSMVAETPMPYGALKQLIAALLITPLRWRKRQCPTGH